MTNAYSVNHCVTLFSQRATNETKQSYASDFVFRRRLTWHPGSAANALVRRGAVKAVSNLCCPLVSHFESTLYLCNDRLLANITPFTKPEAYNVYRKRCRRKTEQRTQATFAHNNFVKFGDWRASERYILYRQTDRQTLSCRHVYHNTLQCIVNVTPGYLMTADEMRKN